MEKPKILVIDDEAILRDSVQTALKRGGYELFFAENGAEGLELFQEFSPILIITDLRMPVMDGLQFLEKLQINPTDPYLTIVLTGHGDDEEVEACYDLGVHAFLRKPFSVFELRGLVKQCIQLKRMQEQMQEAYEKIEELTMMKDKLIITLAQTLQHPLSSILEDTNALRERLLPSETYGELLQRITGNAAELSRFVEVTLDVSEEDQEQGEKEARSDGEIEEEPEVEELQNALEEAILKQKENEQD